MSVLKSCFIVLLLLIVASASSAQDPTSTPELPQVVIPLTQTFPVSSESTGRDYQIMVSLPGLYTFRQDLRFPVVYLTDANLYFGTVNELTRIEASTSQMPWAIVVGIGYPENSDMLRGIDFVDEADQFLQFLSEELIPSIDSSYRTDPEDRTLIGYSGGGSFAFHTLFHTENLFQRYVIMGPGMAGVAADEEEFAQTHSSLPAHVFVSGLPGEISAFERLLPQIQERAYEGLEIETMTVENSIHELEFFPAIPYGLRSVYRD